MAITGGAVHRAQPPTFRQDPDGRLNVLESHTTPARGGIKRCFEPGSVEARKHPLNEIEIYATDQIRVLLSKRMEGTVDQRYSTGIDAWLVATVLQGLGSRVRVGQSGPSIQHS